MTKRQKALKARVKAIRRFVPAMQNWNLREPLTPAQKGWLTRYEKQISGKGNIVSLTKRQSKLLPKDLQIGKGVRATAINVAQPGDKILIKKNVITVKTAGRIYRFIPTLPDIDSLIKQAEISFDKDDVNQVFIYNSRGRSGGGARDLISFAAEIAKWFQQYTNISDWILGIVELVQI